MITVNLPGTAPGRDPHLPEPVSGYHRPMRIAFPGIALALLLSACSGNPPVTPPFVGVGGWAWAPAPADAVALPLPVLWWGSATPTGLQLLPGDCSGSVQALTAAERPTLTDPTQTPIAAGISVSCAGANPTMKPVVWLGSSTIPLALPTDDTQGTALAVSIFPAETKKYPPFDIYAAGASGGATPWPMVWLNGTPTETWDGVRPFLMGEGYDSGTLTSVIATSNYVIATGVLHVTGSSPPRFAGLLEVLDPTLRYIEIRIMPMPAGFETASVGGTVPSVLTPAEDLWLATSVSEPAGPGKSVVWTNSAPDPSFDLDFTSAPWTVPTGISMVDGLTPYLSGYVFPSSSSQPPQPAIWATVPGKPTVLAMLPVADPSDPIGAGEDVGTYLDLAYVAGETCLAQPGGSGFRTCLAALWTNGGRVDLGGLSAAGPSPLIEAPLHGWWRLPGTPDTSPPDWPYPGGTGAVLNVASAAAAGSSVARALVTVPP